MHSLKIANKLLKSGKEGIYNDLSTTIPLKLKPGEYVLVRKGTRSKLTLDPMKTYTAMA